MRDFRLTARQRELLRAALKSGRDGAVVKRIVALLELDRGVPVGDMAERLGVTRQTVYNWARRFDVGGGLRALCDRARRGRTPKLSAPMRRLLVWLLKRMTQPYPVATSPHDSRSRACE